MNYANVLKRFVALVIDSIILYIVGFIISLILSFVINALGVDSENSISAALGLNSVVGLIIGWLYYAIQESSRSQATIGKQAMGLVVTDINGEKISFVKATIRHFSKILSALLLLIGYIIAFFTEKKQALHDLIAGTVVLQK